MDDLQQQKLDALKELAYGASHEINNPLANIAARAQSLLRDEGHPERRRALEAIYQQAMRAHEMISDLMLFARPPQLHCESVELQPLLDRIRADMADRAEQQRIQLEFDLPPATVSVEGDPVQLQVALEALCINALEAVGEAGEVRISLSVAPPASALIEVVDNGPGISEHAQRHLFDPFFSGREAGRGLGFGLSKCWRIITLHGGSIEARNRPDGGASFLVNLPQTQSDGE